MSATASVRATSYHEGTTSQGTILADVSPVADETPTYEITGDGKEYFRINKNGKIKLDKPFDSTDRKEFNLVVKVTAGTETVDVPVKIDVLENLAPDFTTACQSSCALAESAASGTVIINASRTDKDIDDLTYSLENDFDKKFTIDSKTGEVKLNEALDYETTNSYDLKVIATDSKGITKERSSTFNVTDVAVGYNGSLVAASQAESIATGTVILNSSLSGGLSNPTYSLSGGDSKFSIDASTGRVTLTNNLDFETDTSHTFTVTASAGGETETKSFTLNVSDVGVGYNGTLVSSNQSEIIPIGTTILNSSLGGSFSNPSYAITGGDSKFAINASTGQVTLANPLDYETKTSHQFTITVSAGGESEEETFTLNVGDYTVPLNVIAENGQAVTNGASGSQYNLGEFSPVGTVVSNANSPGASGVTYGLIKHGTNPLQIDTSTGQVTLGSALDYETANNFRYQVTATKGGETIRSGIITYQVNDEYYTMPSFNSTSVTNTNFVGNRMLQVTNKYWHHSSTQSNPAISAWIPNDLGKKDAAGRVIADFGQGLPAGTTYELSFPDTSSMSGAAVLGCGGGDCFEIDSNGVLRVAAGKILNSPQTGEFRGKSLSSNAFDMESTMINKLAGYSTNGYQWRDNYGARVQVKITPPNEGSSYSSIHIKPVRTEAQENVVMRFGNNLIDTGGGYGADSKPFSIERYTKRRMAHNTSIQLECCTDSYGRDMTAWGGSISESVLVSHQLEGNTKLASATTMVGGGTAYYGQSNGAKTYYRTNTVANGLNENDTNILDFEYWFPVDNAHDGHSVTGTDKTKGVYAPLAVTNANWDGQMSANEQARYGCYNSGQGCGSGTHELSISGSMVQSTETTPGTFSGYQVKDWNLNMNSTSSGANGNHLLNADNNGANAGTGTGTQTLLALGKNDNGESQMMTNFNWWRS